MKSLVVCTMINRFSAKAKAMSYIVYYLRTGCCVSIATAFRSWIVKEELLALAKTYLIVWLKPIQIILDPRPKGRGNK